MKITSDPGFLKIQIDAPSGRRWGGDIPVEVRDSKTFALRARGVSGGEVSVPEGKYWVGAILPDGQQLSSDELVHVKPGDKIDVKLRWEDSAVPELMEQAGWIKAMADFVAPATQYVKTLLAVNVRGNWLATRLKLGVEPKFETISNERAEYRFADLPLILQLSTGPGSATYFAVPVDGPSGRTVAAWELDGTSGAPRIRFDFQDPQLNSFFDYVQDGAAEEARSISRTLIGQAEEFVEELKSPLRAALAAYVLLRANEIDGLDRWSDRLCFRCPWLPDGVAIRIEYLAREGRHAEAAALMPELAKRGAPWFRSGVAYAASRAKLYASVRRSSLNKTALDIPLEVYDLVERMAKELDEIVGFLDIRQMISVYRNLPRLA